MSITSASLFDPNGCVIAVTPTLASNSIESPKGKKASDEVLAPTKGLSLN